MHLLLAVLLAAQLGGPFDDATARAVDTADGDRITVEISVAVDALNVNTVVVHVIEPGGAQHTHALVNRADLRYGAQITVPRADHVVVFEAVAPGDAVLSQPTTLTGIGLDPESLRGPGFSIETPETEGATSPDTRRWGWAALALGAASLALLAVWAAGPRTSGGNEATDTDADADGG